jgi:hypothetical protein
MLALALGYVALLLLLLVVCARWGNRLQRFNTSVDSNTPHQVGECRKRRLELNKQYGRRFNY